MSRSEDFPSIQDQWNGIFISQDYAIQMNSCYPEG